MTGKENSVSITKDPFEILIILFGVKVNPQELQEKWIIDL